MTDRTKESLNPNLEAQGAWFSAVSAPTNIAGVPAQQDQRQRGGRIAPR